MTNTSKTLVFFGNERLSTGFIPNGAPTLEALIAAGYTIKAVVSHFSPGRSRKARTLEIEEVAAKHNIPVMLPEKLSSITEELRSFNADAGVLIAYGKMVPDSIISLFPRGIINIHPSLLPLHRGSTPIEQTILDGDREAGVSVMALVKEMDAGPVYAQSRILLHGQETKADLTQQLLELGGKLLIENLPAILNGSLAPTPQDESKATYTKLLTKEDGVLDPSKPADQLAREIRAFASWPKSRTELFGHQVIITKADAATKPSPSFPTLTCANNTYLEVHELVGPSGKTMTGDAFLRGYSKQTK